MLTNDNPEVIDDILPMTFMSVTKMLERNPLLPTSGLAALAGSSLAKGTNHIDALKLIEMIAKQRWGCYEQACNFECPTFLTPLFGGLHAPCCLVFDSHPWGCGRYGCGA